MIPPFRTLSLFVALTSISTFAFAAIVAGHDDHDHAPYPKRLSGAWYQPDDHPAHALFKRGPGTDGINYAPVGSAAWSAGYPPAKPDPSQLPQAWVDALNAAVQAGKIPNIPPTTLDKNGLPIYPTGLDPLGPVVCSTYYKCMKNNDTWNAPDGVFGASFDDGPLPGTSPQLYNFLQQNGVHATHFFIGVNILRNPTEFTMAFDTLGDDIAVHTWTHPLMTTQDNTALLGEFGWSMEIIHNSTGGRLPKYWRPPYGDSDNRVSTIAKEVFGLETIVWNQDTEDWKLLAGGTTPDQIQASMTKWLTGPKSPGLIILEHELYNQSVGAFITAFPMIKSNGWKIVSVAQLDGGSPYSNSASSTGSVTPVDNILANGDSSAPSSNNAASASSSVSGSAAVPSSSSSNSAAGAQSSHPSGAVAMMRLQMQDIFAACITVILSAMVFA